VTGDTAVDGSQHRLLGGTQQLHISWPTMATNRVTSKLHRQGIFNVF
jgi:hypothetical protein